ncbi:MAG TPA: TPM domain-containing protein [Rhodanobacteraceae bacterium]|nr:TPM domain-containing protein [Rhodanobacteraceae bacterium]
MPWIGRLRQNLFSAWWALPRRFPARVLGEIAAAIKQGESRHLGEIRFAVESRLPWWGLLDGLDARQRARDCFARLGVWDTRHNTGILIYVLLAERRIEIVADRGITARVDAAEWRAICQGIERGYARSNWREGSLAGVQAVNELLARHFPADGIDNPDELGDQPIIL